MAFDTSVRGTKSYRYYQVDVFTEKPLEGNPLAVVVDADDLDSATMQRIARESNLSETTFILRPERPESVACVRIFTPLVEMQFAGHPTIGTASVILAERDLSSKSFALDEQIGPIRIRVEGENDPMLWLQTPPITIGRIFDEAGLTRFAFHPTRCCRGSRAKSILRAYRPC